MLTNVGKNRAYDLMKFDEDYVDDFWYDFKEHNCVVLYEGDYFVYHCDCDSGEEVQCSTYEECVELLYN